uniref:Retrovirus-related Pol polyprotein from transposon TNT 1-94-like beta-barrel domain-containing protein n=1 Tax=Timema bartmani TaxID=61472 RepID=A0A7R9FBW1_9NEOP|nr:unnamed protein product [Timema bartmani]
MVIVSGNIHVIFLGATLLHISDVKKVLPYDLANLRSPQIWPDLEFFYMGSLQLLYRLSEECQLQLQNTWTTDSWASSHMAWHRDYFDKFVEARDGSSVRLGDNHQHFVKGKSDVMIRKVLNGQWYDTVIKDVLFVTGLKKNLMSEIRYSREDGILFIGKSSYIHQIAKIFNLQDANTCRVPADTKEHTGEDFSSSGRGRKWLIDVPLYNTIGSGDVFRSRKGTLFLRAVTKIQAERIPYFYATCRLAFKQPSDSSNSEATIPLCGKNSSLLAGTVTVSTRLTCDSYV